MSRLGFFTLSGAGHLNPATALARSLEARGHEVIFFHSSIVKARVRAAGLAFHSLDAPFAELVREEHRWRVTGGGFDTRQLIARTALNVLARAREAVGAERVDALLVDQFDLAAGSVADLLKLPFVTVCFAPPVGFDNRVPPANVGWRYRTGPVARLGNRLANALLARLAAPVLGMVNERRRVWGLAEHRRSSDVFSKLAIVAQIPRAFDFPQDLPPHFSYTGPFQDARTRRPAPFPWERLDGRPLVYASMGTVRNEAARAFRTMAEACSGLNVQLVLSLGGALSPEGIGPLPGDPIVVQYAPQLELLDRAALTITHAGLNTTLESLSRGVPLVAIPVTDDQPGVAARVQWTGCGTVVPFRRLSAGRLRAAVRAVIENPDYRAAARRLQSAIEEIDGLDRATHIIEQAVAHRPARFPSGEPVAPAILEEER